MFKERRNGKKNEHGLDKPMFIKTDNYEIITNDDMIEIIDAILDNEENIYPRSKGFLGCEFFLGELNVLLNKYGYRIERNKVEIWM